MDKLTTSSHSIILHLLYQWTHHCDNFKVLEKSNIPFLKWEDLFLIVAGFPVCYFAALCIAGTPSPKSYAYFLLHKATLKNPRCTLAEKPIHRQIIRLQSLSHFLIPGTNILLSIIWYKTSTGNYNS